MKQYRKVSIDRVLVAIVTVLLGGHATAQQNDNDSRAEDRRDNLYLEEVVVTGRAGTLERTKLETSYAITTATDDDSLRSALLIC
jgi:hypothetical protein